MCIYYTFTPPATEAEPFPFPHTSIVSKHPTIMKLVKFLQKLNREQVTIELKNGTVISGTVVGVDATMNAHLKKAKLTARGKNPVSYATLSVRGSTVRAWLLPDGLNLDALLVEENKKVRYFFVCC